MFFLIFIIILIGCFAFFRLGNCKDNVCYPIEISPEERKTEKQGFAPENIIRLEGLPFLIAAPGLLIAAPILYPLGLLLNRLKAHFLYDLIHSYIAPAGLLAGSFAIASYVGEGAAALGYFGMIAAASWGAYIAAGRLLKWYGLLDRETSVTEVSTTRQFADTKVRCWLKAEDFTVLLGMAPMLFIAITDVNYGNLLALLGFFVSDLSHVGYLANNQAGARVYNFFNSYLVAVPLTLISAYFFGAFASYPAMLMFVGMIVVRIALNRVLGFGLKYEKGVRHTHLGEIRVFDRFFKRGR